MVTATLTPELLRNSALALLAKSSTLDFSSVCKILGDDVSQRDPIPFVPFDYQRALIEDWDSGQSMIILKARQLGISWLVGMYMLRRAMLNGWAVGYYSRGKEEAIAELESRVLFIYDLLPKWIKRDYRRRDNLIEFDGGGSIRVFPSTRSAGVGYTFQLIVADEAAHHEWGATNYVNYRPTLSAGGQYICFSSADAELGPSGFFYDLWQGSQEGTTGYKPVFLPWDVREGRDEAWLKRERASFATLTNDQFNSQYPSTPGEAFVGKSGLVFPQFSMQRHVGEKPPIPWENCLYRCAGYDLGGGDPTAIVFLGAFRESGVYHVYQYAEWVKLRMPPTIEELFVELSRWHDKAPFAHIEGDPVPGGRTVAAELRRLNLPVRIGDWSRGKGLGLVANYLDNDWLKIDAACTHSVREFSGYNWVERVDPQDKTRYRTSTPVDHHGDAMDARRYALMGLHRDLVGRIGAQRNAYSGVNL